jgi:hypothetical protein
MSQHDEFTSDGRRILQALNVGPECVQEIENTFGGFWVCSCGIDHCQHIQQVNPPTPRKKRIAIAMLLRVRRKLARLKWPSRITNQTTNQETEK